MLIAIGVKPPFGSLSGHRLIATYPHQTLPPDASSDKDLNYPEIRSRIPCHGLYPKLMQLQTLLEPEESLCLDDLEDRMIVSRGARGEPGIFEFDENDSNHILSSAIYYPFPERRYVFLS